MELMVWNALLVRTAGYKNGIPPFRFWTTNICAEKKWIICGVGFGGSQWHIDVEFRQIIKAGAVNMVKVLQSERHIDVRKSALMQQGASKSRLFLVNSIIATPYATYPELQIDLLN